MIITRVAWAPFHIPFRVPYETARGVATHRVGYIVRAETDGGFEGLGEASLDPAAGEGSLRMIEPHLQDLANVLVNAPSVEVEGLLEPFLLGDEASRAAHCALEMAISDAGARAAGLPIAHLLADQFPSELAELLVLPRSSVAVNATIAARSTEEAAAACLVAVASGFDCVKLKAGMESSIEAELSRIRAVREVIGPGVKLRIDANGAWDEATAIATITALDPFDIELVEQPVAARDVDALARVRSAVGVPLAADESAADFDSAVRAMQEADLLVLKPMRLGGLSVSRYLAQQATSAGSAAIVTTTIDTGIATAAALQIAASLPEDGLAHGLATANLLEADLLKTALPLARGRMTLPRTPGLGIELDEVAVAKYLGAWQEVR